MFTECIHVYLHIYVTRNCSLRGHSGPILDPCGSTSQPAFPASGSTGGASCLFLSPPVIWTATKCYYYDACIQLENHIVFSVVEHVKTFFAHAPCIDVPNKASKLRTNDCRYYFLCITEWFSYCLLF